MAATRGSIIGLKEKAAPLALAILAAVVFSLSTKPKEAHFDYTYRIAGALLHGQVGLSSPLSWLNELVPLDGEYYSVFPLGAVLSLLPLALLGLAAGINDFPGGVIPSLIAGLCVYTFYELSGFASISKGRRALLALFPVFGTWTWCNLGFSGAWQIALGFALLGQAAAFYFTLVRKSPVLAGACFALAFGNRTEIILTMPIHMYWWAFGSVPVTSAKHKREPGALNPRWNLLLRFLIIPVALGLATAAYNFARFDSIFDFGYARIPGVTKEAWYQHGLFSFHAIPWNIHKMLFEGMQDVPSFPYLRPYPFGGSIFLSSPFLFLLFREGGRFKAVSWLAVGLLTLALWCHGNPGGWQFSYRYAMVLLPWMFLLLVSNGPPKLAATEWSLFLASTAINAMAVYQFLWTDSIQP